jgi:hypothetical protein
VQAGGGRAIEGNPAEQHDARLGAWA